MLLKLARKMIAYQKGDPKRIQHFFKVHSFARLIGVQEGLSGEPLLTLEAAALVHDIGIREAERRFGSSSGKLQEQLGPPLAEAMLRELDFPENVTARVSWLVGHHHTYTDMAGLDYHILVEADFLVNLYEEGAEASAVRFAYEHVFTTETGRLLCRDIYGL